MTLYHFGVYDWEELQIADKMASFHGLPPDTRRPIPVRDLAMFFQSLGWEVESNLECAARAPEEKTRGRMNRPLKVSIQFIGFPY